MITDKSAMAATNSVFGQPVEKLVGDRHAVTRGTEPDGECRVSRGRQRDGSDSRGDLAHGIEIAQIGDLIIIDRDFKTCSLEDLPRTQVLLTVVGGKVVL